MGMENNRKYQWGVTLACLGGLCTILGTTTFKDSAWEFTVLIAAVVLALVGIYLMQAAKKEEKNKQS